MRANAIAVTRRTSQTSSADAMKTESPANVAKAVDDAHVRGLMVLLKPHVDSLDGTRRAKLTPDDVDA